MKTGLKIPATNSNTDAIRHITLTVSNVGILIYKNDDRFKFNNSSYY
jgi:hypothetical protein